jgi:hypothetical protein
MARRGDRGAGLGCASIGFLVLVALCNGAGSGGGSGSSYSVGYTPPVSVPAPAADREPQEWLYIHGTLNVRAEPDRDARILGTLSRGDLVQLGPRDAHGWARIYTGYPEGYVYRASDLVRITAPAAPQPLVSRGAGSSGGGSRRSSAASHGYHTGPRGGCYYYSSSGGKVYVDHSYCH